MILRPQYAGLWQVNDKPDVHKIIEYLRMVEVRVEEKIEQVDARGTYFLSRSRDYVERKIEQWYDKLGKDS